MDFPRNKLFRFYISDYDQQVIEQNTAPRVDYKAQYNTLKKKLKFLLYVSRSD